MMITACPELSTTERSQPGTWSTSKKLTEFRRRPKSERQPISQNPFVLEPILAERSMCHRKDHRSDYGQDDWCIDNRKLIIKQQDYKPHGRVNSPGFPYPLALHSGTFTNKGSCLSAHVFPWAVHFRVLHKSPSKALKGAPLPVTWWPDFWTC